jgi:competence protein ComEC
LRQAIPEPEAAVTVGVVTGDRTSLPVEIETAFQRSGTTHVLAISGENISLLVGTVWLLLGGRRGRRRLPPWLLVSLFVMVAAYTLFTGASPSVVRAAIMSAVLLLAPVFGRRYEPISALAVSSILMTAVDPNVLVDPGFQLSFAAMLGIGLLAPKIATMLVGWRAPTWLAAPLAASLGAQLSTFPLIAVVSGIVSPISPVATLVVDLALLPLMVSGIATAVIGSFFPALATVIGLFAWACGAWMIFWIKLWTSVPYSYVDLTSIGTGWVPFYYAALGFFLGLRALRTRTRWLTYSNFASRGVPLLTGLAVLLWVGFIVLFLVR